jgi:hypothetical protein
LRDNHSSCYFLKIPTKSQKQKTQCRAFGLLVIVFFSCFISPLTLAMPQLNGCTMECCEEEGYCCCVAGRFASLHEQSHDEEIPAVSEWQSLCDKNCATPQLLANAFSIVFPLKTITFLYPYEVTATNIYRSRIEYQAYLRLKKSSPRAPPIIS